MAKDRLSANLVVESRTLRFADLRAAIGSDPDWELDIGDPLTFLGSPHPSHRSQWGLEVVDLMPPPWSAQLSAAVEGIDDHLGARLASARSLQCEVWLGVSQDIGALDRRTHGLQVSRQAVSRLATAGAALDLNQYGAPLWGLRGAPRPVPQSGFGRLPGSATRRRRGPAVAQVAVRSRTLSLAEIARVLGRAPDFGSERSGSLWVMHLDLDDALHPGTAGVPTALGRLDPGFADRLAGLAERDCEVTAYLLQRIDHSDSLTVGIHLTHEAVTWLARASASVTIEQRGLLPGVARLGRWVSRCVAAGRVVRWREFGPGDFQSY